MKMSLILIVSLELDLGLLCQRCASLLDWFLRRPNIPDIPFRHKCQRIIMICVTIIGGVA